MAGGRSPSNGQSGHAALERALERALDRDLRPFDGRAVTHLITDRATGARRAVPPLGRRGGYAAWAGPTAHDLVGYAVAGWQLVHER